MTDDGMRCGAMDSRNRHACVRDDGHDDMHSNGKGFTWTEPQKKPKRTPTAFDGVSSAQACGNVLVGTGHCLLHAGHQGEHVLVDSTRVYTWDDKRDRNDWVICGEASKDRKHRCVRPFEHDDDHTALTVTKRGKSEVVDIARWADGQRPKVLGASQLAKCLMTFTTRDVGVKSNAMPAGSKICGYPRHPAAALYPMLEEEELAALAEDIKENGLRDALILVDDGKKEWLLDGSNRGRACELAGVKPRFEEYSGPTDMDSLVAFVISKNDKRRHLTPSVRAMIAAQAAKLGRGNPGKRETGKSAGLTQAEAGKQLRVSERMVRKAVVVRDNATSKVKEAVMKGKLAVDAAELVSKLPDSKQDKIADAALARKSGEIRSGKIRALVNQEKKRDVVRKINEQRVAPLPSGPFGLIYGDYPWHYDNSDQHEGSRGHLPYPTMELDEVAAHALEVAKRAAKHCVIALWSTNLYITRMDQVIQAFGAERRTVFTWPKPKFGVGGWGRGQTEHLVIASIGDPVHTLNEVSTLLPSWQPAHSREHSSKPAEVAALLRKHCSGPFLELFGREEREGWTVWGAEVDRFKRAA
jgi:N6-adenosine-specific RNA methylase IME4